MADIAALQLPTMSSPCFLANSPTRPDSTHLSQLLWRCSPSSVSVRRETFQNRRALSALDSLARDDCHCLAGFINSAEVSVKVQRLWQILVSNKLLEGRSQIIHNSINSNLQWDSLTAIRCVFLLIYKTQVITHFIHLSFFLDLLNLVVV